VVLLVLHALEAALATRLARFDLLAEVRLLYSSNMRIDELVEMGELVPLLWCLAVPLSGKLWSSELGVDF
jgi:hypothetical protein